MKKVFLAIGIIAFLITGAIAVESMNMNPDQKVVYDDPPKAKDNTKKSCCEYSKTSCCSSKAKKDACKDGKETKATETTTDKDGSPDKK
ncbi:MAG: hypothetical protein Kow00127_23760 [Bacteroidales bacterium]